VGSFLVEMPRMIDHHALHSYRNFSAMMTKLTHVSKVPTLRTP